MALIEWTSRAQSAPQSTTVVWRSCSASVVYNRGLSSGFAVVRLLLETKKTCSPWKETKLIIVSDTRICSSIIPAYQLVHVARYLFSLSLPLSASKLDGWWRYGNRYCSSDTALQAFLVDLWEEFATSGRLLNLPQLCARELHENVAGEWKKFFIELELSSFFVVAVVFCMGLSRVRLYWCGKNGSANWQ